MNTDSIYKLLTAEFVEEIVRQEMIFVADEAEDDATRAAADIILGYYSLLEE